MRHSSPSILMDLIEFRSYILAQPWDAIEKESGLLQADLQSAAGVYAKATTRHRHLWEWG